MDVTSCLGEHTTPVDGAIFRLSLLKAIDKICRPPGFLRRFSEDSSPSSLHEGMVAHFGGYGSDDLSFIYSE